MQALYHLTRTLDPTRPVIGNDGWESVATDIIGIHDYDADPERLARRYHADDVLPRLFKRERPGGRLLVLEGDRHADQPIVLSEFGGIALAADAGAPGATRGAGRREELAPRYERLLEAVAIVGDVERVLLHAVRRHLSGGQRAALRRSHAEVSARADCGRHAGHFRALSLTGLAIGSAASGPESSTLTRGP